MYLRIGLWTLVLAISGSLLPAQTTTGQSASKNDTEIQKQALQAEELYGQQNFLGALPLFEDLHKQRPESNVFRERLAMTLLAKAGTEAPADAIATRDRARKLLLDAKATGDNSNLLQILLEKLSSPTPAAMDKPKSAGADSLAKAEKAFSSGDLAGALVFYKQAAEADPNLYEPPLFAGDTEYKLKNYDEAGAWYAKAIAINPDRETAYRYWGDVLMHKGDQKQAQSKFIDAVIAEPYSKASWIGLKQWADATHAKLASPAITLPKQPVPDEKGNVNVTIDPSTMGNPTSGAWLIYAMNPTVWRKTEFKKHYPSEAVYRHSLAEEAESLRTVIAFVNEKKIAPDQLDPTLKSLIALDKDGMLECWILLNHADQGIAQDYVAFREKHRDLLHAYMDKYVVHF
ncbi:MAG TPA: tetratricopeptide repeat protein [Edaphobacter sp.]|jgi:tetratricopeptide (TPR) repeat protein|nr:tetratricopeptide repeat protein [Edaphobacter sp.]